MNKNTRTGSRLFFIEFLIVLLFFLIISTVCLKLFVTAHSLTQDADALYFAQSQTASVAEALEACSGEAASMSRFFPEADFAPNGSGTAESSYRLTLSFDRKLQSCALEDAAYLLTADITVQGGEKTGLIAFCDQKQTAALYELPVRFHQPITRGEVLS